MALSSDGICGPKPGDGEVNAPEQCDDGNTLSGDGCSPDMTIEDGFNELG